MDIDQKIYKECALTYDYIPDAAKQLAAFIKAVHHFVQYMGAHKYYSDALNKRIALLALDADQVALRIEKSKLEAEDIYSLMELAIFAKKKPALPKSRVDALKAELALIRKDAQGIHSRALVLMDDIRREYAIEGSRSDF